MRLAGKVALVTGAANGIGLACAERYAREGAEVVLADVDRDKGEKAAAAITEQGGAASFLPCDVGDKGEVDGLVAAVAERHGRLDVALANAAIVEVGDFLDFSEEAFDRVIRVNLKGVFLTGQAAARQMVRQDPDAQGSRGTIVNMSSVNGVMAIPSITPYVAAKGGVNQLTKVMALALADRGIRVNGIGPGTIMTEMAMTVNKDPEARRRYLSRTPMGRGGEPDEVARVAVFLATEDSSYITGQIIYVDGGRLALNYTVPVKD